MCIGIKLEQKGEGVRTAKVLRHLFTVEMRIVQALPLFGPSELLAIRVSLEIHAHFF